MISEYGVEKQVTFFGRVSEEKKMELMARAHILLHASVREGWGLVVLEAAFVVAVGTGLCIVGMEGIAAAEGTGGTTGLARGGVV